MPRPDAAVKRASLAPASANRLDRSFEHIHKQYQPEKALESSSRSTSGSSDGYTSSRFRRKSSQESPADVRLEILPYTGKTRLIEAFTQYPLSILAEVLEYLDYDSFMPLLSLCSEVRAALNQEEAREVILQRYLGAVGYRSYPDAILQIGLRDLAAFQSGSAYSLSEYTLLAMEHKRQCLALPIQRILRASTRAHNRLVIRLRTQPEGLAMFRPTWARAGIRSTPFKQGRAASLRVWIPCAEHHMSDSELVECER